MTDEEIFSFDSATNLLNALVGQEGRRSGRKKELANALGCQPTYFSQVLRGKVNLSLEQAMALTAHMGWSDPATEFFLTLVQLNRAGTTSLRKHFERKLDQFRQERKRIETRVMRTSSLSPDQQSQYYSSWLYSAVHIALSIPQLQSEEAILSHFCCPPSELRKVLRFLVSTDLATQDGNRIAIGPTHIHLSKDSHLLNKHLTHWRLRAIDSIDKQLKDETHYSVVMSLSKTDVAKCQEVLIQAIQRCNKLVATSPEEVLYCQNIDFFKI